MNLVKGVQYKVIPNHRFHADRIGYFEFLGGPDRDVIVLSDLQNPRHLFAVGMRDLTEFDPAKDKVIEKGIREDERFRSHDAEFQELKDFAAEFREGDHSKVKVKFYICKCPHCGEDPITYPNGVCEYCGGKIE